MSVIYRKPEDFPPWHPLGLDLLESKSCPFTSSNWAASILTIAPTGISPQGEIQQRIQSGIAHETTYAPCHRKCALFVPEPWGMDPSKRADGTCRLNLLTLQSQPVPMGIDPQLKEKSSHGEEDQEEGSRD